MTAELRVAAASSEPDPAVLAAAIAGDRHAQGVVARAYYPRMRRWALLECADPQAAEEAVQEALIRWVRHGHSFDPSHPFTPWLRTLVRNACRDAMSKRRRTPWFFPRRSSAPSPERSVEFSLAAKRVIGLLGELTPRQRAVLDLVDLQGCSAVDAAAELGLTAQTTRVHLHDARKRLQGLLDSSISDILKGDA